MTIGELDIAHEKEFHEDSEDEGCVITDEKLDFFFTWFSFTIMLVTTILFGYFVFSHKHFEECSYIYKAEQKFEIVTSDTYEEEIVYSLCIMLFDSGSWFLYGFMLYIMLTLRIALANSYC